ncbi:uncharacterized protein LOC111867015 [Cryptotermes secundus]|uniref:uncharacterized protein LOC111867015 n=1 Tax=Cryptotermes secundus TaxID=105785 RepID=UPI000CD7D43C|nr:uncharacterized protein LOC111867015 [Cryptotermes secundus]
MNCTNSENVLVGPYGETYPASHDASQAMNIKAEDVSDLQEEADPVRITFQEIKAEPENCRNLENASVGPYGERCPTPHDANQAMNVKAEAASDADEEEDPVPLTFPEIKAEPEAFGVADAAEGLTCSKQCRATCKGWMKRQITVQTLENKKCEQERRWAE